MKGKISARVSSGRRMRERPKLILCTLAMLGRRGTQASKQASRILMWLSRAEGKKETVALFFTVLYCMYKEDKKRDRFISFLRSLARRRRFIREDWLARLLFGRHPTHSLADCSSWRRSVFNRELSLSLSFVCYLGHFFSSPSSFSLDCRTLKLLN